MISNKLLAPIYFIAFVACFVVFVVRHQWLWLTISGIWLALGIAHYIRYNKNDDDSGGLK